METGQPLKAALAMQIIAPYAEAAETPVEQALMHLPIRL